MQLLLSTLRTIRSSALSLLPLLRPTCLAYLHRTYLLEKIGLIATESVKGLQNGSRIRCFLRAMRKADLLSVAPLPTRRQHLVTVCLLQRSETVCTSLLCQPAHLCDH